MPIAIYLCVPGEHGRMRRPLQIAAGWGITVTTTITNATTTTTTTTTSMRNTTTMLMMEI